MISLKIDTRALDRAAAAIGQMTEGDMAFALAYGLTKGVSAAKQAEVATMRRVFDSPTSYTLNAFAVLPATKDRLEAELFVREFGGTPAWKYLGPQVHGGARRKKGFERALERAGLLRADEFVVPTKFTPLDGNGNIVRGFVTRVMSDVGANPNPMANTPGAKRRDRHAKGKGTFFVARARGRLPAGIYFRLGQRHVRMVLAFVRAPNYKARFPYYEVARDTIPRVAQEHFEYALTRWVYPKLRQQLRRVA